MGEKTRDGRLNDAMKHSFSSDGMEKYWFSLLESTCQRFVYVSIILKSDKEISPNYGIYSKSESPFILLDNLLT